MSLPNPTAVWAEDASAAQVATRLYPYKTAAGYWVFVPRTSAPAGSTPGALVQGTYDTLLTSTTTGLRITRGPHSLLAY
jgi:hypothetical protein